ncbi:MAG TPA: YjbH domain-containing protein [Ramlibacter sp.]|nr:YjbH domain-containing protein [Ramlibacter sp.]
MICLAAAGCGGHALAVESTITSAGFTGLEITPNARLLEWGRFSFTYDRQLPGARDPSGHNFVGGFGLLPNLEVVGRIAANSPLQTNCFVQRCNGIRDLSVSFKGGIGLDAGNRFFLAAGATDVGGAATNFRSYYGVLTYSADTVELSGGLAKRQIGRSPLDGPFAGAAWQPLPWLRGHLEYSDKNAWAGVRLFAPQQWLPEGWRAHVGATARLTDSTVTERSWITAGVSIPLYKVPPLRNDAPRSPLPQLSGAQLPLPAYEARTPAPGEASAPSAAQGNAAPVRDDQMDQLAAQLQARGLEDIWVGRMADGAVAVRANNATYNWNSVDAVGAALAAIGQVLGTQRTGYRLVLTQRQLPLVGVTGQTDCLAEWIARPQASCAAGELSTPGTMPLDDLQRGATWMVRGVQPSWKTLRVAISPALRLQTATEVGTLDYSVGVNLGFSQPLWSGASVDWHVTGELARTDDFRPGGVFASRAVRNGTDRLSFTQSMRLPLERWMAADDVRIRDLGLAALTAQVTLGRLANHFDGAVGELRWEPGEGRHRVSAQAGWLHNSDFGSIIGQPREARPALLSYRYHVAPTRTYVEATGGQFLNNDRGLQVGLRQWFGDIAVQAFVRRTTFSSAPSRTIAGLEVSLPLGPRRDMNPGFVQVTGTPRFSITRETVVGETVNVVTFNRGLLPPVTSLDQVHNSDRAGLLYFEDNVRRLRDAAR